MIGMTIYAIQSRNEAQHQQAEAEGLVEYMLTDLRTELKGVGRLDVMTKVNERAMDYYDDQADLSDMPAESLERRARILHAMGEDDEKRGDLDKALAKFTEAHRVTAALLARDPENPDRIFGHAQSEYWVGYIAYMKNDWETVEKNWLNYRSLARSLVESDPINIKWLREEGYAVGNLCTLELRRTDGGRSAISFCKASLQAMQLIMEAEPNSERAKQDLANRFGWLAEAQISNGDLGLALIEYSNQEKLIGTLVKQKPSDLSLLDQWVRILMTIAELHEKMGNFEKALSYVALADAQAKKLIQRDPQNQKWQKWKHRINQIYQRRT